MKLVLSGLPGSEQVPAWVQAWVTAGVAEWVSPQVLLAQERGAESQTSPLGVIWLYHAPWSEAARSALRLNSWMSLQRQALKARASRARQWTLVNLEDTDPAALAEGLGIWLDEPGETAPSPTSETTGTPSIWAKLFEWAAPQAWDLFEALEASAWSAPSHRPRWVRDEIPIPSAAELDAFQRPLSPSPVQAQREAELQALLQKAQDDAQVALHEAREQNETAKHALEEELERLRQALSEVAAAKAAQDEQHAKTLAAAERDRADMASQCDATRVQAEQLAGQLKEAKEESELLLLQLHQVQEELEQLFLKAKDSEASHQNALAQAQSALDKARSEAKVAEEQAAKALADARAALDQALKGQASAEASLQRAQSEAKATLENLRGETQASLQRVRTEAQAHASALETQLKEAQEEGELLLLQLHQVQEELETHFLRGKDLEQQSQQLQRRYERLQRRYPHAIDIDAVQISELDASGAAPGVTWRLLGLSVEGRIWPELTLKTSLQPDGVGFAIETPSGTLPGRRMDGPLIPKALAARDAAQVQRFRTLGATVWRCLVAACAAVDEALGSPTLIEHAPADFDAVFWRQALGPTAPLLRALPAAFRHDGVRLKREKVNPDYEHLWLVFERAHYGPTELGHFEMRLGAAQVRPRGFSTLPKLEFPLNTEGKPPFDGWFEESSDDFGPKLELRADLSRQAFDVGVWSRLPKSAQAMLLSCIAQLPANLQDLAPQSSPITRAWNEWTSLAEAVIAVMRHRLSPAPARAPQLAAPQPTAPQVSAEDKKAAVSPPPPTSQSAQPAPLRSKAPPPPRAKAPATASERSTAAKKKSAKPAKARS